MTETVAELMTELGSMLENVRVEPVPQSQIWAVHLTPETAVQVEVNAPMNSLVLSSTLGRPARADRAAVYENLLSYNFHWDATGGARMALTEPDGDVELLYELPAHGVDATQLGGAVLAFAGKVVAWRQIISQPPPGARKPQDARNAWPSRPERLSTSALTLPGLSGPVGARVHGDVNFGAAPFDAELI